MRNPAGWTEDNVRSWILNDEALYLLMMQCIAKRRKASVAAARMLGLLNDAGVTHTPDGARYTLNNLTAVIKGEL
jgi:hypothetical protein